MSGVRVHILGVMQTHTRQPLREQHEMLSLLIRKRSLIDEEDHECRTSLYWASIHGHTGNREADFGTWSPDPWT